MLKLYHGCRKLQAHLRKVYIWIWHTISPTCHLERNEVKSRDLRTNSNYAVSTVRRFLDSLRSLGMTDLRIVLSYGSALSRQFSGDRKGSPLRAATYDPTCRGEHCSSARQHAAYSPKPDANRKNPRADGQWPPLHWRMEHGGASGMPRSTE